MDLVEFKKYQSVLMRIGFFVSVLILAFPVSIFIVNAFQLNLNGLIGFSDNTLNLVLLCGFVAIVLVLVYELIISLIFSFFKTSRMFFNEQASEVKFILRIAFAIRTIIVAGIYIIAIFFHPIFNYISLLKLFATLVGAVAFYFIAKNQFGGYAVAAYIFKQTAKIFFFLVIVELAFDIGGILLS